MAASRSVKKVEIHFATILQSISQSYFGKTLVMNLFENVAHDKSDKTKVEDN